MPSIMALEGSRFGAIVTPRSTTLLGVTDTFMAHPIAIVAGLVIGGWLAYTRTSPLQLIWGENRMKQSRSRSLHGRKGKRR